jgi:Tfp pilus assembly protein PilO
MDALRKTGSAPLIGLLAVAVLAIAFWVVLLSPKQGEAAKLGEEIAEVESSLAQHRAEVDTAEAARKSFPVDYRKLVVLGKAVPANSETPSLLVQVSGIAERTGVEFKDIELSSAGGGEEASSAPTAAPGGQPVSATEAAASLLPLGASVGTAGLATMPYTLTFEGSFFKVADFIKEIDSLVKTPREEVLVDGRLLTIDGFSLSAGPEGFPSLTATFAVTSYVTPPAQGTTAGATPASPTGSEATPAAAKLGGTP